MVVSTGHGNGNGRKKDPENKAYVARCMKDEAKPVTAPDGGNLADLVRISKNPVLQNPSTYHEQ